MIRDIRGPVYFSANYLLLIIAASLLILSGIIFAGVMIYKKLKKQKPAPLETPISARENAITALEALRAKDLPASGKAREYYYELSDIVRKYTEEAFAVRAPEMTTEEFLHSPGLSQALSGAQRNMMKEFLKFCDIVKFARYGPDEKEMDASFYASKKYIDET